MTATLAFPAAHLGDLSRVHLPVFSVVLEEGFPPEIVEQLQARGHKIVANLSGFRRSIFGRGQIIRRDPKSGVLWGGSDPRADGQVLAW